MIFFRGVILSRTVIIYDLHRFMTSSSSVHRFITNQFNDLLPVGLLAQLVERCTGFLFATAKVVSITAMIFFHIIFHYAVLTYDFHLFLTSNNYIV